VQAQNRSNGTIQLSWLEFFFAAGGFPPPFDAMISPAAIAVSSSSVKVLKSALCLRSIVCGALPQPRSNKAVAAETLAAGEALVLRMIEVRVSIASTVRSRAAAATSTIAFGRPPGLPLCPRLNFLPGLSFPFRTFPFWRCPID
jgi:hypothetical protein